MMGPDNYGPQQYTLCTRSTVRSAELDSLAHEDLGCDISGGAALCRQAAIRHKLLRKAEVRHLHERVIRLAHQ